MDNLHGKKESTRTSTRCAATGLSGVVVVAVNAPAQVR
jgi:hypothetical protein